jgi:hypothetical protein
MRPETLSATFRPVLSVAGVNLARLFIKRQVVLSSERDPLD